MTDTQRDALIEAIVKEVLRRLEEELLPPTGTDSGPRVAVALSATVSQNALSVLEGLRKRGYRIGAVIGSGRMPPARRDQIVTLTRAPFQQDQGEISAETVALVAPELSITDAAKLATGILDDPVPESLWRGLVGGLPVFASPGDGFSAELPRPLARIANDHRVACQRLGVQWSEREGLLSHVAACLASDAAGPTVEMTGTEKRLLVTEAAIAALPEGVREAFVPHDAVLTPLARDRARQRGISIRRRS